MKDTFPAKTTFAEFCDFGGNTYHGQPFPTHEAMRDLFLALVEFAEAHGVDRHPESTLTQRLEAATMGVGR